MLKLDVRKKEVTLHQSIQQRKTSSYSIFPFKRHGLVPMILIKRETGHGLMGQNGVMKTGTKGKQIMDGETSIVQRCKQKRIMEN